MVFSGIVEELGTVVSLEQRDDVALWGGGVGVGWVLKVGGASTCVGSGDAYVGCSIAVNGTCLTVTSFEPGAGWFTVGLAPETCVRERGREGGGCLSCFECPFSHARTFTL
jgi:riboflavin synthase